MKHKNRTTFLAILLPVQIVFIQFLGNHSNFIETYYSQGIYPYISRFLRFLFGWIPFSVGDLLIAFLLFLFVRFLYLLIKNRFKGVFQQFIKFTALLSTLYLFFYFFWGLNYYRNSLAKNLHLPTKKYSDSQLLSLTKKLIKKSNEIQFQITQNDTLKVVNPYKPKEIYKKAVKGYAILSKTYPQFTYKTPSVKSSLMSGLQTYNGTSGYFNPLTGEAQINDWIPTTGMPFVTCHEMAHQLGWAAENEANFVGFLAALANKDLYFKYAAYKTATQYLLSELYKRDRKLYKKMYASINKGIQKDFRDGYLFWHQYENLIEPIVKKGYNAYLKANNQKKGIQSYNYIVDLLLAYFDKNDASF